MVNNWITARETALARVRSLPSVDEEHVIAFTCILARCTDDCRSWHTGDERQAARVVRICEDLALLADHLGWQGLDGYRPWDRLYLWASQNLDVEAQELTVSLMIEPYGDLVDDLLDIMSADERAHFTIDGAMTVGELHTIVNERYGWVFAIDFGRSGSQDRYWYVSENKLEPARRSAERPGGDG